VGIRNARKKPRASASATCHGTRAHARQGGPCPRCLDRAEALQRSGTGPRPLGVESFKTSSQFFKGYRTVTRPLISPRIRNRYVVSSSDWFPGRQNVSEAARRRRRDDEKAKQAALDFAGPPVVTESDGPRLITGPPQKKKTEAARCHPQNPGGRGEAGASTQHIRCADQVDVRPTLMATPGEAIATITSLDTVVPDTRATGAFTRSMRCHVAPSHQRRGRCWVRRPPMTAFSLPQTLDPAIKVHLPRRRVSRSWARSTSST